MDSSWAAGCILCKEISEQTMSQGQIVEQVPHYHVFEPLPSPVARAVDATDVVVLPMTTEFRAANRLAQIRKHHRHIKRMQNDLAAMASCAQLPKRAREEMEEELFGNEICSSSSSDDDEEEETEEAQCWAEDTNGRFVTPPTEVPK